MPDMRTACRPAAWLLCLVLAVKSSVVVALSIAPGDCHLHPAAGSPSLLQAATTESSHHTGTVWRGVEPASPSPTALPASAAHHHHPCSQLCLMFAVAPVTPDWGPAASEARPFHEQQAFRSIAWTPPRHPPRIVG
jgi:hypothetical protein